MIIAVDFDGTIVEHRYPKIGKEIAFAIDTLRKLQAEGHTLILWTIRENEYLEAAVEFCEGRGLRFNAVNCNYGDDESDRKPGKVYADVYIDDRNIGGLPDWGIIYMMIHNNMTYEEYLESHLESPPKRRSIMSWLRKK